MHWGSRNLVKLGILVPYSASITESGSLKVITFWSVASMLAVPTRLCCGSFRTSIRPSLRTNSSNTSFKYSTLSTPEQFKAKMFKYYASTIVQHTRPDNILKLSSSFSCSVREWSPFPAMLAGLRGTWSRLLVGSCGENKSCHAAMKVDLITWLWSWYLDTNKLPISANRDRGGTLLSQLKCICTLHGHMGASSQNIGLICFKFDQSRSMYGPFSWNYSSNWGEPISNLIKL